MAWAAPASAVFFTIDGNGNGLPEFSPTDDLLFSEANGASGIARAVDYTAITAADIESSSGSVDFSTQDVFFFAIFLDNASSAVSEIRAAIGSSPPNVDPQGIGYLKASFAAGDDPDSFNILTGGGGFPGTARYVYSPDNLVANETTRVLFATWTAGQLAVGQTATFMVTSGTAEDFSVQIVPEPASLLLLGTGILLLTGARSRCSR